MGGHTWAYKAVVLVVALTTLTVAGGFGTTGSYLSDTESASVSVDGAVGGSVSDFKVRPREIEWNSGSGAPGSSGGNAVFTAFVTVAAPSSVDVDATRLTVSGTSIGPIRSNCRNSRKCTFTFNRSDLLEAVNGTGEYQVRLTFRWRSGVEATVRTTVRVVDKGGGSVQTMGFESEAAENESETDAGGENGNNTEVGNETASGNETALVNETVDGNQTTDGNQTASTNQTVYTNQTTDSNQTASTNQTVYTNQTTDSNQTTGGNETASENETVTGNQTAQNASTNDTDSTELRGSVPLQAKSTPSRPKRQSTASATQVFAPVGGRS